MRSITILFFIPITTTRSFASMLEVFLLLFIHLPWAICSPYVGFPFNEQLPNVARVDEAYTFTLANITYKSNADGVISYNASNLPDWLSFDAESRTFSGKPSADDVGEFTVLLAGTDSADSEYISNDYTMLVSNDTGLHLSSDDVMFTQIAQYGDTNGIDGLVVSPGQSFNIQFSESVFQSYLSSERDIVAYYGRLADRSSLPNWISFNSDDLSFSGTVPYVTSSIAPSIEYGFTFIASDYKGYAGAEGIFKLVVGAHSLSTSLNETIKVNGTLGDDFDIAVPILSRVYLDNVTISRENISLVEGADLPDYVSFNSTEYTLTGEFPEEATFDNFTIVVKDVYGNEVSLPYLFDAIGLVFTDDLPDVNATRSKFFSYQILESYFTDYNSTKVTVDYDADWLTYHEDNNTFTGTVPKNFDELSVKVKAVSDYDSETKSFDINGVSKATKTSSSKSHSSTATSSSSSTASSTESSQESAAPASKSNSSDFRKKLAIGLGVGIPAFLILVAAIIFLCCCCTKRRKQRDTEKDEDDSLAPTAYEPELYGPGFGTTHDKDDHDEEPKQLASLNVLKLDEKDTSDVRSTSSSLTHVDDDASAQFYDASEKPIKSWRAMDASELKSKPRDSQASMSTVNTEQLFSVRLVDDHSNRQSVQLSAVLSNNSLNALLKREDSGNIQRLDLDGNVVETLRPRVSRSPSANLDVLVEEKTPQFAHEDLGLYHSASEGRLYETEDLSSANLLAKFENSEHPSTSSSSNYLKRDDSAPGEFRMVQNSQGEVQWSSDDHDNSVLLTMHQNGLRLSVLSDDHTVSSIIGNNAAARISNASLGKKAKLVDFTRKGSLRESAHEPDFNFHGHLAAIHDSDSE